MFSFVLVLLLTEEEVTSILGHLALCQSFDMPLVKLVTKWMSWGELGEDLRTLSPVALQGQGPVHV